MLQALVDRANEPPTTEPSVLSAYSEQVQATLSALATGQTALLEQISSTSHASMQHSRDTTTAVEAIRSMKEDLELRKVSAEQQDEVISALRIQADGARQSEIQAFAERDEAKERLDKLKTKLAKTKWDREELVAAYEGIEEREKKALARADEMEAGKMAVVAERDGLAAALRESFTRQRGMEVELDRLQREVSFQNAFTSLNVDKQAHVLAGHANTQGDSSDPTLVFLDQRSPDSGGRQQGVPGLSDRGSPTFDRERRGSISSEEQRD